MQQNTLQLILEKQEEFQTKFGFTKGMDLKERVHFIHTHSMFLVEEVYEMLRELPFHKPWKDYSDWDEQKVEEQIETARKEFIDILIFLANVGIFLGFDEEQIRNEYLEKLGINHKRQEDPKLGYVKH